MDITVAEADDNDMYRIFEICSLAFGTIEPFFNATWPDHWTDFGRLKGGERFQSIENSDPNTRFFKAVDGSSGKILGMAKWNIYNNTLPDFDKPDVDQTNYWKNEGEKEYQAQISKEFFITRNAAIKGTNGNVVCLDILAVDPVYHRKGVGSALVAWGAKKADEMNVDAVVEASPSGKGLYEKHGFVYDKYVVIEVPEPWADRQKQEFAWLVRPKK